MITFGKTIDFSYLRTKDDLEVDSDYRKAGKKTRASGNQVNGSSGYQRYSRLSAIQSI